MWNKVIAHADMDAFFASVEMLDAPWLAKRPLIVGGKGKRSVVSTANYVARQFGVHSAQPMSTALRLCPDAVVREPRMHRYHEVSARIMSVFASFSPKIEPLSCDEAFIDLTECYMNFPSPEALGQSIKAAIYNAVHLTVSVGISDTKFLAKIASDYQKPNGLTVVRPNEAQQFLDPLPISRLWGAGPKTAPKLIEAGYKTIGDIARTSPHVLYREFGSMGLMFHSFSHNIDPREVEPERIRQSLGAETTFPDDLQGESTLREHLHKVTNEFLRRLHISGIKVQGLRVKLKTAEFKTESRQRRLATPTDNDHELDQVAQELLKEFDLNVKVRLLGVTGYDLFNPNDADNPTQLSLPLEFTL